MIRPLTLRSILLLTIGFLTLLIVFVVARETYLQWERLSKIYLLQQAVSLSDRLSDAAEALSRERGSALILLHIKNPSASEMLQKRLSDGRAAANENFDRATKIWEKNHLIGLHLEKEANLHQEFDKLRAEIDHALTLPLDKRDGGLSERWMKQSTAMIVHTQNLWMDFVQPYVDIDHTIARHMRLRYILGTIMEYAARERSLVGLLISQNRAPTAEDQIKLLKWQGGVELGWELCASLAKQSGLYSNIESYFLDARSHYFSVYEMVRELFYVPGVKPPIPYPISVELWIELATQTSDSLDALKNALFQESQRFVDLLSQEAQREIMTHGALLLIALGLCFYSFWIILHRVLKPIHIMVEALIAAMQGRNVTLMPRMVNQQDEIGKLAQVLHAFQQNLEQIKHTSLELERYTHALERSNKELDDFAYIASHDLKEPLRGIHNHSRFLLEDNQEKINQESVTRLHRLIYLSQRMELLVNDLLYFSRLGRQEMAIQPADVNEIIRDIENTLDLFLGERGAQIVIPKPLPTITCDKTRLTEVFRNLITNAVKYNDKPKRTVEIGFLASQPHSTGALMDNVFYVRDNGLGIAAEFREEIFRIFKRLQSSKEGEEGTGVGLTFVKKIIERHGGKIWLDSEPGHGTVFYFTLEGDHYEYDAKAAA